MSRITVHEDDKIFFKRTRKRFLGAFVVAALLILAASLTSKGAALSPETLKAWDTYVRAQNARVAEYSQRGAVLWSDQSGERLHHLHNGEAAVTSFGENPHPVQKTEGQSRQLPALTRKSPERRISEKVGAC